MGGKGQKKTATPTEPAQKESTPAPAAPAESTPAPAAEKKSEPKPAPAAEAKSEAKPAAAEKQGAKKQTGKKAGKKEAVAEPAEQPWVLVTTKHRNAKNRDGKKNKKEEQEKEAARHPGGRGQAHGGGFRGRRQHPSDHPGHIEHSSAPARVALFVTNEQEEDALRGMLIERPFEIVAVVSLEGACNFSDSERKAKVRIVSGVDAARALMKELDFGVFVLPVDDDNLPGPRMNDEVTPLLDVAVRAGAYAMTVSVTPLDFSPNTFFAAVPTQESMQLLINTLGLVKDEKVRQDFEIHGFEVPEKVGIFDIYTSLMNSSLRKYKDCDDDRVLSLGDQFVQDIAARIKTAAHYPVFTVSFRVGKLICHESRNKSHRQSIYEIQSDDVVPESLKNIFLLIGHPLFKNLTIPVSKYTGEVTLEREDPEEKVDVEFEKIIYANNSNAQTPVFELYLPRYVDPTAVAATTPETEESSKKED